MRLRNSRLESHGRLRLCSLLSSVMGGGGLEQGWTWCNTRRRNGGEEGRRCRVEEAKVGCERGRDGQIIVFPVMPSEIVVYDRHMVVQLGWWIV